MRLRVSCCAEVKKKKNPTSSQAAYHQGSPCSSWRDPHEISHRCHFPERELINPYCFLHLQCIISGVKTHLRFPPITTMPQQIIYNSLLPPVEIKPSAIFTYAFSDKTSRDHSPAYIDAASGTRISRSEIYELSLQFAYALKQRGRARGEIAMILRCPSLSLPLSYCL
jgi:hypothetical protein